MKFTLTPHPPFDFGLTAGFFSTDDDQIRKYVDGKYWQVLRVNDKLALSTISNLGSVNAPKLAVELKPDKDLGARDKTAAIEIISSIFNLDLDLNEFYQAMKKDKIMSKLSQKLRGLKGPNNTTVFEGLVCSIIEQQISLNVAFSIQKKVTKQFGDKLRLGGKTYYSFPTPETMAKSKLDAYRTCGLSQRKAEYIRDISRLIVDNELDLEKYKNYSDSSEIINELTKVRGIGVWTVELTMLRSMQRFDVVPADDLGLRRYVSHHYFDDKKITSAE
ncbi:DNA-3-methyladenine glycosylase family protein, partial [[Eubacterium] cellulosolvens]